MRSFVLVETRAVAESRYGSFCDASCDLAAKAGSDFPPSC
jgi:hypothetical protein